MVIDALGSAIAAGTVVRHRLGWREHAVVEAAAVSVVDVDAAPAGAWLGILGQTGFTAYVGLTRIAQMRPGDVVFISAAAGAVGSAAGRFAKLLGAARVIGSAGGTTKVRALVDELGYDDAFDPRRGGQGRSVAHRSRWHRRVLRQRRGAQLVAALEAMRLGGRVALCGMISQFDESGAREDINRLIERSCAR